MTTTSIIVGLGGGSAYKVNNSLRFRSSASAYLNRTPATTTNQKTFTLSCWFKGLPSSSANYQIFSTLTTTSPNAGSYITFASGNLAIVNYVGGALDTALITNAVYRDPSAWYHIVFAVDTTQSTSSNRVKIYVNGVQITSFSTSTYSTLNSNFNFNSNVAHIIGAINSNSSISQYIDGYFAEFNWIDGQALTPSSFGTYDTNGVWQPINYSGSYGTNGFHLTFSNTTSTTTLVADSSGNGNNWTPNNISLTAGTTYDSMTDSPTVTSASVANYATLNPLGITSSSSTGTANGNLQYASTGNGTGQQTRLATMGFTTGKWYYEWIETANTSGDAMGGWANNSFNLYSGNPDGDSNCWGFQFVPSGPLVRKKNGATSTTIFSAAADGDVMMVAVDLGAGKIWIGKNGVWSESGVPSTGTNAQFTNLTGNIYYPYVRGAGGSGATSTLNVNYGQQPFTYTPPTGFNALNTYNLPTPTIANGAQYMAATLYNGNNAGSQTILNSANNTIGTTFQPDFLWIKNRGYPQSNTLYDVLRGVYNILISNSTVAEDTETAGHGLSSFNSNGFSLVGEAVNQGGVNTGTYPYVAWQWKANGSGVSNTNGSITSTVSANTTAGFSVATFTGTGAAGITVGHGLGVAPNMMIVKSRGTTGNWLVYHSSLGNTGGLALEQTAAFSANAGYWNNTSPTSSVFTLGTFTPASTAVAYCWAAVAGYSAFGSYTGNGSTDGAFVYTGFRPRFVLVKASNAVEGWVIWDSSRDTYNTMPDVLYPNLSNAEGSNTQIDFLSNGFKLRNAATNGNISGNTYIYAAFAENPLNYSRAR